jgi:polysaccharide deacetylase family sporulation protein PdaB
MKYNKYNLPIRICIVLITVILVFSILKLKDTEIVNVFAPKRELPIYSVERDDKKIAITIDAAWGDEFTLDILNTLDKYNVKATFFLVGFWVDKYPHQVEEIFKRGHEIGNHSTTHPHMTQLSREKIAEELSITDKKITEITNVKPRVFRAPFGDYNDLLIQTARDLEYNTIQWDIDSLDWKELGVEPVIDRVVKNAADGSIILFHNNAKYIKEYLPVIIQTLQEKGFKMVTVSELIHKNNFEIDNNGRQILTD